ncbi:MAG TPA: N-acetylglucosamine-6-phosphate deacetylase, partial [Planctomycetota bacterium]|nr:N-acetylglucosamine-6-phosphate deacetylase [Planctomycetota bacterium]
LETGAVSIVTLAPELRGVERLVRLCADFGVVVSMGHSDATLDEARRAAKAGARSVTHLFNAMRPFHHRDASLASFALLEPGFPTELIGDLVHVSAPAIDLVLRARGLEGIRLVSDGLRAAGTRRTRFTAGGARLVVRDGTAYRAGDGIAGSCRSLASMVAGLARTGLLSLEEAWRLASDEPARLLRLRAVAGYACL